MQPLDEILYTAGTHTSSLRATLQPLIGDASWQARLFGDAEALFSELHAAGPACLAEHRYTPRMMKERIRCPIH